MSIIYFVWGPLSIVYVSIETNTSDSALYYPYFLPSSGGTDEKRLKDN